MQINNPVHEIEADEADRKDDARVFVDIGRGESAEFVEVFAGWDDDGATFFIWARSVD